MKKFFSLIVAFFFSFGLTACGDDIPDAGDYKRVWKKYIAANCDVVKLTSVEKINGRQSDTPGLYYMDVKYAIEWEGIPMKEFHKKCKITANDNEVKFAHIWDFIQGNNWENPSKGEFSRTIRFQKTENGWIPVELLHSRFR